MWFFRSPTVVFGEEALFHIRELRGKRALVVTDKAINGAGLVAPVLFQLQRAGISSDIFDDVEAEPSLDTIESGAVKLEDSGADWIVAVGGGSVLDAAKAMWVLYENPDLELESINPLEPIKLRERARMIAVPTTAGTGSEVTWAFVVTVPGENGAPPRKLGSGHPLAVPDYAIVDPVMSASMPARLTADTGMDALTQAIEGYLSNWANDYTDGLCLIATRLAFNFLTRSYRDPADREAAEKMANAAAIGGLGYINSMVGLAHSLGHAIGAVFKVPHGRAVGMALPIALDFYAHAPEPETRCAELLRFLGDDVAYAEPEACQALADRVRTLAAELDLPPTLAAAGVTAEQFEAQVDTLVDQAMGDTVLFTSPRQPSEEELRQLFAAVFSGARVDF
jgi:alcohol dehydrogenase class IV